jgi:magnesium-transporting ATPase (P-type)
MGSSFYGKEFLAAVDEGKIFSENSKKIQGKSNIDGVDIADIVEGADGFAQVAPKHKYYIVDVLQKRGHVTGIFSFFSHFFDINKE